MQSTEQKISKPTPPALASGFGPVPTRIGARPTLLVANEDASAAVRQQVIENLHEFAGRIAVAHRSAAEAWLSQNLYKEALPHLEAAVRFAPDDLEYANQLGFVRYITGDDQGAIAAFVSVLERQPGNADSMFNLGMVLFGQGEFARAEECFARVCDVRPDDHEAWNNRGVAAHRQGRTADAAICFRRALAINPSNEDAKANLATLGAS